MHWHWPHLANLVWCNIGMGLALACGLHWHCVFQLHWNLPCIGICVAMHCFFWVAHSAMAFVMHWPCALQWPCFQTTSTCIDFVQCNQPLQLQLNLLHCISMGVCIASMLIVQTCMLLSHACTGMDLTGCSPNSPLNRHVSNCSERLARSA